MWTATPTVSASVGHSPTRLLHPGAVGITQATNALAFQTCCDVTRETAVAYSAAQQLMGVSRSAELARDAARRSSASSPSVELTNTRRR
jgi:hypothetical protein